MSLQSNGSSFTLNVSISGKAAERFLEIKKAEKPRTPNFSQEESKKRFIEAMTEFANSDTFEALTYELSNSFSINVDHHINLSMPG